MAALSDGRGAPLLLCAIHPPSPWLVNFFKAQLRPPLLQEALPGAPSISYHLPWAHKHLVPTALSAQHMLPASLATPWPSHLSGNNLIHTFSQHLSDFLGLCWGLGMQPRRCMEALLLVGDTLPGGYNPVIRNGCGPNSPSRSLLLEEGRDTKGSAQRWCHLFQPVGGGGGCSVPQLCPSLCHPVDCRTPDFSVLHYLPEFA